MQRVVQLLTTKVGTAVFMQNLPWALWVICDIQLASLEMAEEGHMSWL